MSNRIRILPESITNKIAAGEVVERPASVVKELVENALDSGCREVTVEVEAGGKRLIKVSDDGPGMSREDALMSLERHATSKIATDSDLFSLSSLGFRGEALPSIASVSRFHLATMSRGAIEGTEIYAEGGRIKEVKACGMAEGTVVSVRNLFFNTPARLKFMKSNETEAGHVGDLLTRLAISRPETRFTYMNDGRTVFRCLDGDLKSRIATLLGANLVDALFMVDRSNEKSNIRGFISGPELNRSSASHFYTFVNGRFIRDKVVQHAIVQGYRNFMERGRYPVVVLFIEVPSGEVDVNVHPTKHEVRFREQGAVHDAIQEAVASVLGSTPWLKRSGRETSSALHQQQSEVANTRISEVREALSRYNPEPGLQRSIPIPPPVTAVVHPATSPPDRNHSSENVGYFSALTIIGQFHASYIICQEGTDLILIDQHAAHERVAFEQLKKQFGQEGVETQGLLFPENMELSHRENAVVLENQGNLTRLGFDLEPFGGSTWLLKGVPTLLAGVDCQRTCRDIIDELMKLGRSCSFTDAVEGILARMACHSVVRGVHPLTIEQIRALFTQMDSIDFASNCPHGRPVLQRLTLGEIEKMFRRG